MILIKQTTFDLSNPSKSNHSDRLTNTQNTRGHGCKFRVPAGCVDAFNYSFFPTTTYSDLEPIAGCCHYVPFHRGLQVSIDGLPGDSRHFRDIRPVFISHSSTFLSVGGTWTYRLLPALYAHLPLLNCEECVLLEKKKKKKRNKAESAARTMRCLRVGSEG